MNDHADFTFEAGMTRLEEIVRALDTGGLPLTDSLVLFEEGVGLARQCSLELSKAQGRLDVLTAGSDGSVSTEPLDMA